jgi:hypothetical protein
VMDGQALFLLPPSLWLANSLGEHTEKLTRLVRERRYRSTTLRLLLLCSFYSYATQ